MIENDLISVIVPVYNVESYLKRCIDSILKQTYSRLEIILVDDGSKDSSGDICDAYALRHKQIKVIHKSNGGLSQARNYGIRVARGKYLLFVDSDDVIHSQLIECLYKKALQYDAEIVFCEFLKFENDSEINDKLILKENIEFLELSGTEACNLLYDRVEGAFFVVSWAKLYKKDLWNNIEFPEGRIHEDNYTTYKIFLNSNKVIFLKIPLYFYCQRVDSIMNSKFNKNRFDCFAAYELQINTYISLGLNNIAKKAIRKYLEIIFYYKDLIGETNDKKLLNILRKQYNLFKKTWLNETYFTISEIEFYNAPWFNPQLLDVYWHYIALKKKWRKK